MFSLLNVMLKLRIYQTFFQNGCTILSCHQQCIKINCTSHFYQHMVCQHFYFQPQILDVWVLLCLKQNLLFQFYRSEFSTGFLQSITRLKSRCQSSHLEVLDIVLFTSSYRLLAEFSFLLFLEQVCFLVHYQWGIILSSSQRLPAFNGSQSTPSLLC